LTSSEEAAFTDLVRRQSRFVFRVAYAVLLNTHDAEDMVQELFVKLYQNGAWREARNEQAFLARVAWRTALDRRRASKRSESIEEGSSASLASAEYGAEETLLEANRHAVIHALIDALPEELRVPLVLSADELNSREIAAILHIPEGTVRTRLQRARQILRQRLGHLENRRKEAEHA
jgi:RNA polymerase sigma-70 factor, ECF subfamily